MKIRKIRLNQDFLEPIRELPDMPERLWIKGELPSCQNGRPKVVSIVGSRKNTKYGETIAYQLAYELAQRGIVIISGLAYGIDAAAHRGCIDAGGTTIAILGTPIESIYPKQNVALGNRILEKGAIISEYDESDMLGPWAFVRRNRLVSGLADAVIVVEAAIKSGSLTTATWALEQGRELFAVPGDITGPMSVGCNKIIKQGAHVLTETEDVLGILFPNKARQLEFEVFGDNDMENNIINELKSGNQDGEQIIDCLKIKVPEFNQAITMLEIKGVVRSLGGNQFRLN